MYDVKLVWKYAKWVIPELVLGSLLLITGSVCTLSMNYLEQVIIDDVFLSLKWMHLFKILLLYGLLSAAAFITGVLAPYILIKIQAKLRLRFYEKLMESIYKLPTHVFLSQRVGKYVNYFSYDVVMASLIYIYTIPEVALQIASTFIIFIFLFIMNKWLCLFSIVCSLLYVLLQQWSSKRVSEVNKKIAEEKANITVNIEEGISATREIVSLNREEWARIRLEDQYDTYMERIKEEIRVRNQSIVIGDMIEWIPKIIILLLGGYFILKGYYTIGFVYLVYQYISKLMVSANQSFVNLLDIKKYIVSLERLEDFFSHSHDEEKKEKLEDKIKHIQFCNIGFQYPKSERKVLKGINLEIPISKTTVLAGASGSGKSTLIRLLAGFYIANKGEVYINQKPLTKIDKSSINAHLALVLQEPYFFSDTVLNNIVMGRENLKESIVEICKIVQIYDFIMSLPEDFQTILTERGTNLSGGQKQRIALARALIGAPEILILDEATSALDVQTERLVMDGIREKRKGKTTIIVAHRLSTVKNADKIVIFSNGVVSGEGTHEQLYSNNRLYKELIDKQE